MNGLKGNQSHEAQLEVYEPQLYYQQLKEEFEQLVETRDLKQFKVKILSLHDADLADLLEETDQDGLDMFYQAAPQVPGMELLVRLSNDCRHRVLAMFEASKLGKAFDELALNDVVDIVDGLPAAMQRSILSQFRSEKRALLRSKLAADPYSAERIMHDGCVVADENITVKEAQALIRAESKNFPKQFYDLFVVDRDMKIQGTVKTSCLLLQPLNTTLKEIMESRVHTVKADADQEDVARLFTHYGLSSVPVLNNNNEPIGIILIDDILEVVEEEAEQDIFALGGVRLEPESPVSIWQSSLRRFPWLSINMFTALFSSAVVMFFRESIAQMVLLAVMIPIITSVGGNAATQSMTVSVRHLVTNSLAGGNVVTAVLREMWMGLLNGLLLSIIMMLIAVIWLSNLELGLVCSLSILINIAAATFAGVLIPFLLDRWGFDPAVSSPVFVTMVTDVVGVVSLLGLATALIL